MHENADGNQIILKPLMKNWRQPPEWHHTSWMNIKDDLTIMGLGLLEAKDAISLLAVHATTGLESTATKKLEYYIM